jgi:hypothetical protein
MYVQYVCAGFIITWHHMVGGRWIVSQADTQEDVDSSADRSTQEIYIVIVIIIIIIIINITVIIVIIVIIVTIVIIITTSW